MAAIDLRQTETAPDAHRRLAEIARMQSELAAEAAAIIAGLSEATTQPAAIGAPARRPGRLIDVSKAARIANRGSSWIYQNGPRFGFAWRLASGSWTVDESLLRAFLHSQNENREDREHREASAIPLLASPAYVHNETEG